MTYSENVLKALAFAYTFHQEQTRKASGAPYINHLLAVAALVGEYGGTEEQFIVALLHDILEDQGEQVRYEDLVEAFSPAIAEMVLTCSEPLTRPKPPWRERKEAHLAKVGGAGPEVRLIIAADKIHNGRSILAQHNIQGDELWHNFNGGREGTQWYYKTMYSTLAREWDHPVLMELKEVTDRIEGL